MASCTATQLEGEDQIIKNELQDKKASLMKNRPKQTPNKAARVWRNVLYAERWRVIERRSGVLYGSIQNVERQGSPNELKFSG